MARGGNGEAQLSDRQVDEYMASVAASRAGGTYWGDRPTLPNAPHVLVRVRDAGTRSKILELESNDRPILVWLHSRDATTKLSSRQIKAISGSCDPWHLVSGAGVAYVDADDELALIAALAGIAVRCVGQGRFESLDQSKVSASALRDTFREHVMEPFSIRNPFTEELISFGDAIQLCAFWGRLVDGNRSIKAAVGFAGWKRSTVAPLLWAGAAVPFTSSPRGLSEGDHVAVWKSRVSQRQLSRLAAAGVHQVEVEDGFIRSVGLGANCVPPLSIVVDRRGIYFDPGQASDLEELLEHGRFGADVLQRAADLRNRIVEAGISKYGIARQIGSDRSDARRRILVVGQVEDDRSVRCGGGPVQTNLDLLRRAREQELDAYLTYRPHPDVQAGHRIGEIPGARLAELADEVGQGGSITEAIDQADEIHVNTSLAGFEALLRGKSVTTHGVPFYAGWGLTRDLGEVPPRRTAKRTIDELVAAVLLQYPRYLDPVTGLPCPAEILALRLAEGRGQQSKGALVHLRQMQGRWNRRMSWLRSRVWR